LKASRVDAIVVVTGHRGQEIAAVLQSLAVRLVENPDFRKGMLSSIQRGIAAVDPQTEWLLIALADQPGLESLVVDQLLNAAREAPAVYIPVYGDRRGHPILVHGSLRREIGSLPEGASLRDLWSLRPYLVRHVSVDTGSVLQDLDTPEDYARLLGDEEKDHAR
jgi:molybdenum cofactor cytidylyltransferase